MSGPVVHRTEFRTDISTKGKRETDIQEILGYVDVTLGVRLGVVVRSQDQGLIRTTR